ncbi:hypothetical protein EGH22_00815 [Halomicroarcula sp. F28]|uniref:hypothetical protein n=1 Tax=Haloarcula salinisoli TaxID=2487746 RepID=UPI001C739025|nr:hypothetical protein [Halomicroarcula salinisoli]MBX0284855.1 hypothetical protein [Halomicroarcula salinisoli]
MFDDANDEPETGWGHVASHDDAPAVIDTLLRLDPETTYTKTELSDEAGVALKSLYLDGTLDHLVEMGFLEKHADEGEEALFSVDTGTDVFEAAVAFDDAVAAQLDE